MSARPDNCGEGFALTAALAAMALLALAQGEALAMGAYAKREIPQEHPRLFGSKAELLALKASRGGAYGRMRGAVGRQDADEFEKVVAHSIFYAVEGKDADAQAALAIARQVVARPMLRGHQPFAMEMAKVAIVFDHCYEKIAPEERTRFIDWLNKEYDVNKTVESSVFFNGYYGYKMWGFGFAAYATWPDNPRAREILDFMTKDVVERAIPAQRFAGAGGGWPEGHYLHYFFFEWLLYCEAARRIEGIDYYAMAPEFFGERPTAAMFECWPGKGSYDTRRMAPNGDGGTGLGYGGFNDLHLASRRLLARYFMPKNPAMGCVVAYDRQTPRPGAETRAYIDFLYDDADLPALPLGGMKLAHYAPGAGQVWTRSSWEDDATWVAFRAARRFTAHQHIDAGHFDIWKCGVLAADTGEYADWLGAHVLNWYIRTVAHNCLLVHDPNESFRSVRGQAADNDGGQAWPWSGNGGEEDMGAVGNGRARDFNLANIVAYEDTPLYTYAVADCTQAYSSSKVQLYLRHLLFVRPDAVVVFDCVVSKNPSFKKTWLLHTMEEPSAPGGETQKQLGLFECSGDLFTAASGDGRLVCQTLLPPERTITKIGGKGVKDYWYNGKSYPAGQTNMSDASARWRIEVSPVKPSAADAFLHVMWALKKSSQTPAKAKLVSEGGALGAEFATEQGLARATFDSTGRPGGRMEFFRGGSRVVAQALATGITLETAALKPPSGGGAKQPQPAAEGSPEGRPKPEAPAAPKGPVECETGRVGRPGANATGRPAGLAELTEAEKAKAAEAASALRKKAIEAVAGGAAPTVYVTAMGSRARAKVKSADETALTVETSGLSVRLDWDKMSPRDFYQLAAKLTLDHALLFDFCAGSGLDEEAAAEKTALEKAGAKSGP